MNPKKELGQNFLIDEEIAETLVSAGEVDKNDIVLEIGPGKGFVTKKLLEKAKKVIAVELDKDIIPLLTKNLTQFENIEIINADALVFLASDQSHSYNKIVASIPYQITSPLLHKITTIKDHIKLAALLIQREVADRIIVTPPDTNYLATFLQTFFTTEKICNVAKEAFHPIPQVDGAIVKFTPLPNPKIKNEEIQNYSKFLHHGFREQRKMLNKRFPKELLEKVNIDPTRRAETVSIEDWIKLFEMTKPKKYGVTSKQKIGQRK